MFRRRRALLCRIADGSGFLTLRFFHFSAAQQESLARGTRLRCFGEVRPGPAGLEIVHPEYRSSCPARPTAADDSLTPVYPTTEGVQQGRMRAADRRSRSRSCPAAACATASPPDVLGTVGLPSLEAALRYVHRPPPDADLEALNDGPPSRRSAASPSRNCSRTSSACGCCGRRPTATTPGRCRAARDLVDRCLAQLPFALTARAAPRLARDRDRPRARCTR